MTDSETYAAAMSDWLAVLRELWVAIGKPVDEKRLMVYARQLEIVPLGLLEKSVSRAIRNNGQYQTVPTVGAIWAAVRKELECPPTMDIDEAIESWRAIGLERCFVAFRGVGE